MLELNGQEVVFDHYPNGESYIKSMPSLCDEMHLEVTLRFESNEDLVHLMWLKNVMDHYSGSDWLTMTYVPYSRMDRIEDESQLFSLEYFGDFINEMEFGNVTIIDPHSDVSAAVLKCVEVKTVMDALIARAIGPEGRFAGAYVVFPDAGAQKKYERFAHRFGQETFFLGLKHRNFNTGKIEDINVLCSDPYRPPPLGATAVIVDDLSSYGGTFSATAKTLRTEFGFDNVFLITAHCESSAWKGDLYKYIDHVYTTDSMVDDWTDINAALKGETRPNFITRYSQRELLEQS